jgi:GNAT superfamily N-acetyltransferase
VAVGFRLAALADIELILTFRRELYALDAVPPDEAAARTALADLIRDSTLGRLWLVLDGAEPVGYVALTLGYSLEYHGRDAFVDELFISASHRGQGVGAATMRFIEAEARDLGVHALHLEVERPNASALRLYQRHGFEDHDRYLMTKWLAPEPSRDQAPPAGP